MAEITLSRVTSVVQWRKIRQGNGWKAALFLSPWIVGFAAFILYPMIATLYFSFTDYDAITQPKWVGLDNYRFMFTKDTKFWLSIKNTLWIIITLIPLRLILGTLTAWLLTKPKRGSGIYRTIFFLPSMMPVVATTFAFLFVLNPDYGPINSVLHFLGIDSAPLWFYDPQFAKPAILLLTLWGIGDAMILILASMLDVPRDLYEAADMEGANGWQKFRAVTLPMITPVIFFILVTGIIFGFQFFTAAYVASNSTTPYSEPGSPQGSLLFYSYWLFQQGFVLFHMGYASALAWVMFVITMICTIALVKTSRRWVYYGGGMFS